MIKMEVIFAALIPSDKTLQPRSIVELFMTNNKFYRLSLVDLNSN